MARTKITKNRTKKNGNSKGTANKKIKTVKTNYVIVPVKNNNGTKKKNK